MTDQLNLIRIKLQHLSRMREYRAYSLRQVGPVLKLKDWGAFSPDQHESLAAFRVRFGESQDYLGKAMRAVSIEELVATAPPALFGYFNPLRAHCGSAHEISQ